MNAALENALSAIFQEGLNAYICTEWNEFKHLDLARVKTLMAQPIVADGRNIYEPERMQESGFRYCAVGR